jgi:hypothetical protein
MEERRDRVNDRGSADFLWLRPVANTIVRMHGAMMRGLLTAVSLEQEAIGSYDPPRSTRPAVIGP